jgi:hypothetical protein
MAKQLDWRRPHDDRLLREREIEPVESIADELAHASRARPVAPGCRRCANCGSDVPDLERHVQSASCFASALGKVWTALVRAAPRDTIPCPGCDTRLTPATLRPHLHSCDPAGQVIRAAVLARRRSGLGHPVPAACLALFHPPVKRRRR